MIYGELLQNVLRYLVSVGQLSADEQKNISLEVMTAANPGQKLQETFNALLVQLTKYGSGALAWFTEEQKREFTSIGESCALAMQQPVSELALNKPIKAPPASGGPASPPAMQVLPANAGAGLGAGAHQAAETYVSAAAPIPMTGGHFGSFAVSMASALKPAVAATPKKSKAQPLVDAAVKRFSEFGLYHAPVPGDGNCFFSAIARIILKSQGVEVSAQVLRNWVVLYAKNYIDHLPDEKLDELNFFYDEPVAQDAAAVQITKAMALRCVDRMAGDRVYAKTWVPLFLARMLKINLVVFDTSSSRDICYAIAGATQTFSVVLQNADSHLGAHYDALLAQAGRENAIQAKLRGVEIDSIRCTQNDWAAFSLESVVTSARSQARSVVSAAGAAVNAGSIANEILSEELDGLKDVVEGTPGLPNAKRILQCLSEIGRAKVVSDCFPYYAELYTLVPKKFRTEVLASLYSDFIGYGIEEAEKFIAVNIPEQLMTVEQAEDSLLAVHLLAILSPQAESSLLEDYELIDQEFFAQLQDLGKLTDQKKEKELKEIHSVRNARREDAKGPRDLIVETLQHYKIRLFTFIERASQSGEMSAVKRGAWQRFVSNPLTSGRVVTDEGCPLFHFYEACKAEQARKMQASLDAMEAHRAKLRKLQRSQVVALKMAMQQLKQAEAKQGRAAKGKKRGRPDDSAEVWLLGASADAASDKDPSTFALLDASLLTIGDREHFIPEAGRDVVDSVVQASSATDVVVDGRNDFDVVDTADESQVLRPC
jgi:hypothetical protein